MSEQNNAIITIKTKQALYGMEPETIELVTEGQLRQEDETYILSYQESQVTGMEGTLTTILVEPGLVTLRREGAFNSQLVFEEGRRRLSLYETPYGTLEVSVHTRRLRRELDHRGGSIEVDYQLELGHVPSGDYLFRISVREKPVPVR